MMEAMPHLLQREMTCILGQTRATPQYHEGKQAHASKGRTQPQDHDQAPWEASKLSLLQTLSLSWQSSRQQSKVRIKGQMASA